MTHALRVHIIVTAVLLVVLLAASTVTPILLDVIGFNGAAYAAHCEGSSC